MSIAEYEACLHALSRYSFAKILIESERIHKFIKGFKGPYQLDTIQMVILGASLQSIIKHGK